MDMMDGTDAIALEDATGSEVAGPQTELERLMQEKEMLQTQLVQVQAMLYLVDSYIAEELLRQVEVKDNVN